MKIEMNTIYHLPTQAHEDDFLKQADKQELLWCEHKATQTKLWSNCKEEYCIVVRDGNLGGWRDKPWFEGTSSLPIIEWKIGFSKADMQIGQMYKTIDGEIHQWTKDDVANLRWHNEYHYPLNSDIMEVYPINITPIWKREEPKYRVKTELTKEQAEKLGLELCEVIE